MYLSRLLQVLIPVFALGRAQELCILLETYWERMNIKAPIYFSMGLTEKVSKYNLKHIYLLLFRTHGKGQSIQFKAGLKSSLFPMECPGGYKSLDWELSFSFLQTKNGQ